MQSHVPWTQQYTTAGTLHSRYINLITVNRLEWFFCIYALFIRFINTNKKSEKSRKQEAQDGPKSLTWENQTHAKLMFWKFEWFWLTDLLLNQPLECRQSFSKIWPRDLLLDPTTPIFKRDHLFIKTNILSKFEEDWTKNVVSGV